MLLPKLPIIEILIGLTYLLVSFPSMWNFSHCRLVHDGGTTRWIFILFEEYIYAAWLKI